MYALSLFLQIKKNSNKKRISTLFTIFTTCCFLVFCFFLIHCFYCVEQTFHWRNNNIVHYLNSYQNSHLSIFSHSLERLRDIYNYLDIKQPDRLFSSSTGSLSKLFVKSSNMYCIINVSVFTKISTNYP